MSQEVVRLTETPSEWIGRNYYVPDPRDPLTGEVLPAGPIILTELQSKIIDAALERDENGHFKYSTIVYSAPKKSGKSAITSAVILYMAYHNPNSFLACMANDGKQSADRLYGPIRTCFRLHRQMGGIFSDVSDNKSEVVLPNYTKIEAVTVDAAGEAGSQPLVSAFSEIWGYDTDKKKRMFVEMTVPPTLHGRAIRWIETYAGYSGKSEILETIYDTGYLHGVPHPDFLDLTGRDGPVVKTNEAAGMFVYWDTEPRMLWQSPEYYQQEAAILPALEFNRIHQNMWVSAIDSFVQNTWWESCEDDNLPSLVDKNTPAVVGIDMAVSKDCAALVLVTRDPFNPEFKTAVRAVRIFSPKEMGQVINQELMIRPVIKEWAEKYNVICWVYDPREMSKLAQDMMREGVGWFLPFGQQNPRAVADKQLYDMILHKQVSWNRNTTEGEVGHKGTVAETLFKHVTGAGATTRGESYRLEKLSPSYHIDAAVALSQANFQTMKLALDNNEFNTSNLLEKLSRGEITPDEFSEIMQQKHPGLKERKIDER